MAALATRVKVTYRSSQKLEFSVTFYVAPGSLDPSTSPISNIIAAINAITASWPVRVEISAVNQLDATPTTSAVFVCEDKAEFVFKGENNLAHTYKIPGLKTTILEADGQTIDCTTGAPQTFVTEIAGHCIGTGGEALVAPDIGRRRAARKTLKK